MRTYALVLCGLWLLSAAGAARRHDLQGAVLPPSAMFQEQAAPAPTVKAPDTPAGRALTEFIDSFNAGGKTRQTWLETRTTLDDELRANVLKIDAQLLQKYGPLAVVRVVSSTPESLGAVVRHGTSDRHGYLTISTDATAPYTVLNFTIRQATPEEIKGGIG